MTADIDFSTLSNEQLQAYMRQQQQQQSGIDPAHPLASAVALDAPQNADVDFSKLSDDQLKAYYKTMPPPQWEGAMREPALAGSEALKGAVQSVGTPGSLMAGAADAYNRYYAEPVAGAVRSLINKVSPGLVDPEPPHYGAADNPWTAQHMLETTHGAGLTDRPDLQPNGLGERFLAAGARGGGSVIPYLATGGAGAIARTVAGGVGGGVGERLAEDLLPPWVPGRSFIGATAGMVGGNRVYSGAERFGNMLRGEVSPLVQAMQRQGVTPRMVGDVTQNPYWQKQQANLFDNPNAAGAVRGGGQQMLNETADAIERTARDLDPYDRALTSETTGQAVQDAARHWDTGGANPMAPEPGTRPWTESKAWAPVNAGIPQAAPVHFTNLEQAAQGLTAKAGRLQPAADLVVPPKAQALVDRIQSLLRPPNPPQPGFFSQLRNPNPQPLMPARWDEAMALKRSIGDALADPEVVKSIGERQLRQVYGAIAEDMRGTAGNYGVLDAYDRANQVSTALNNFRETIIGKLITSPGNPLKETMSGDQTVRNALNGGDRMLTFLRSQMPEAADALAAHTLRKSILARPSWQNAAGDQASTGTFLTDLSALRQQAPEGYNALFAPVRPDVDDLTEISHAMRETARSINTSKSASNAGIEYGPLVRAGVGAEMGRSVGHFLGSPEEGALIGGATMIAGNPIWNAAKGRFISSEPVARWLSTPIQSVANRQRLIQALAPPFATLGGGVPLPRQ